MFLTMLLGLNGLLYLAVALAFDRARWLKILAVLFLAGNTILTITDQMGVYDNYILALDLVSLTVLVIFLTRY
jgi:hypothetical protein